jgi:hypothetical protein
MYMMTLTRPNTPTTSAATSSGVELLHGTTQHAGGKMRKSEIYLQIANNTILAQTDQSL